MTKKIAIVDDQTIFREMLGEILSGEIGYSVVAAFGTATEAEAKLLGLAVDLVILDVVLPDDSGLELCARLRKALPRTRVLLVTAHERDDFVGQAERVGAHGIVFKGAPLSELRAAVERVLTLGSHFPQRAAPSRPEDDETNELSSREKQVLILVASGKRNREIADKLGLSERTVENHRQNIRSKLGIKDVAGLVRYAAERGLVDWPAS